MKISQFSQTPTLAAHLLEAGLQCHCRHWGASTWCQERQTLIFSHTAACNNIPHQDPLSSTMSALLRASRSVTEGDMVWSKAASSEEPAPSLKHLCNKARCAVINIPSLLSPPLALAPQLSPNWSGQTMLPPRVPSCCGQWEPLEYVGTCPNDTSHIAK